MRALLFFPVNTFHGACVDGLLYAILIGFGIGDLGFLDVIVEFEYFRAKLDTGFTAFAFFLFDNHSFGHDILTIVDLN
jgi:hypothetical protein